MVRNARATISVHARESRRVTPTQLGVPVVPVDACTRITSVMSTPACRPSGGAAAWLSRSICFSVNGKRAMSASDSKSSGRMPFWANRSA